MTNILLNAQSKIDLGTKIVYLIMAKNIFKGGILVIGSLYWDNLTIRKDWREAQLDMDNQISIAIPIRYGRLSTSQHNTFTMVFSSGCINNKNMGKGWFLPFKENQLDIDQINSQAIELIDAEYKEKKNLNRYNWVWGCLGFLFNPNISESKLNQLKLIWEKNLSKGFNPDDYKVSNEPLIINNSGILNFAWPEELNDFDFLISTLTKPQRTTYPTSREIATAMIENHCFNYFRMNVKNSITTFQDDDIHLLVEDGLNVK